MERSDEISHRVAQGHATKKHLGKFSELGIKTAKQYQMHIASVLRDPQTQAFTAYTTAQTFRQADIFYHKPTNTLIVVPANRDHEPTAYRPQEGEQAFREKHLEAEKIEGRKIRIMKSVPKPEQKKEHIFEKISKLESFPNKQKLKDLDQLASPKLETHVVKRISKAAAQRRPSSNSAGSGKSLQNRDKGR